MQRGPPPHSTTRTATPSTAKYPWSMATSTASVDGEWVIASVSWAARPGMAKASVDSSMPAQMRAARWALGAIRLMATSMGATRVYGSAPLAAGGNDPALAAREML